MLTLQRFNELIHDLNEKEIGKQAIEDMKRRVSDLYPLGLEERTVSAMLEFCFLLTLKSYPELCTKYDISFKEPNTRPFWDLRICDDPAGFKASYCMTYDNLSAPGAILYILTGDEEFSEKNKTLRKGSFIPAFKQAIEIAKSDNSDNDFYCIILNKGTEKLCGASLKTLSKIQTNKKNFLQANWKECLEHRVNRTTTQFIEWISPFIEKYNGYV